MKKPFLSSVLLAVALIFCFSLRCMAIYARVEVERVPIKKLVNNLEREISAHSPESDLVCSGEILEVQAGDETLNGKYTIDGDGTVTLPKLGRVNVEGQNLDQIQKTFRAALDKSPLKDKIVFIYAEQSARDRRGRLLPGEMAQLHYQLARVHSMAYALKEDQFDERKEDGRPFFGYSTDGQLPPEKVIPVSDPGKQKSAKQHLEKAIAEYKKALQLKKDYLIAEIGLAWCLDQSGNKKAAVEEYRKALSMAWKEEEKEESIFETSLTEETARYLLPLLDPKKDAEEIKKIERYKKIIGKKGRAITPLIIPLEPDVTLKDLVNSDGDVSFDLDGSGLNKRWGWITPKAGWLVFDKDGKGQITSGLQMFGNVTFWVFWKNGYQALAAMDNNGDGVLFAEELNGFAIWQDENCNGISDLGEVKSTKAWGITSISCDYVTHQSGIPYNPLGVFFKDGSARPSYDWIIRSTKEKK